MFKKIFIKYIKNYCYYIETSSHVLIFNYTDGELPNFSRKRNKEIFFIVTSSELEYFSEKIFQYKNIKNYHYILPKDMDDKYKAFLKNSRKIRHLWTWQPCCRNHNQINSGKCKNNGYSCFRCYNHRLLINH